MVSTTFSQAHPFARRAAKVRSATAVSRGLPAYDREDLEQEALFQVWRALPRYNPARASLRTFVERVVFTRTTSCLRSRHRHTTPEPLDEQQYLTGDGFPDLQLRIDVERVLTLLCEADRRLVLLLAEVTPTDAGRDLGIGRSTVYRCISRAREAFANAGLIPEYSRGTRRSR